MRRHRTLLALLVLGFTIAALGAPAAAAGRSPEEQVLRAVERANSQRSARFELSFLFDRGDLQAGLRTEGVMRLDGSRGRISVDMSDLVGRVDSVVEELIVGGVLYLDLQQLFDAYDMEPSSALEGKRWIRIDPETGGPAARERAQRVDPSAGTNPALQLGLLEHIEDVAVVGTEEVRGQPTTRYRGVIDPDRVRASLDELPKPRRRQVESQLESPLFDEAVTVDVWVDDDDRMSRTTMTFQAPDVAETPVTAVLDFTLYDFGTVVTVFAPRRGETITLEQFEDLRRSSTS